MAKTFNFSLQKVLDIREHKEDEKSIELGKAQSALEFEKTKLNGLKEEKDSVLLSSAKEYTEQPSLTGMRVRGSYIRQLSENIANQEDEVTTKITQVKERRSELLEAVKERKIVDNLKDRKLMEYKKQLLKAENKQDDEVAGRMVNRRIRAEK